VDRFRESLEQREDTNQAIAIYPKTLAFHEMRPVIGGAFGGKTAASAERIMMYMLQPLGVESDEKTQDRQEVAGFWMGFFAYDVLQKNGFAYGIRENDGSLRAVTVIREYDPAKEKKLTLFDKICRFVTDIRAFITMKGDPTGVPQILQDRAHRKKAYKATEASEQLTSTLHEWHSQYGPHEQHWYVAIVATDPDFQGKGYGKQMMDILSRAADECGVPCYLESPDYNRPFYEKFGFIVKEPVNVSLSAEALGELSSPGYLMTRQPNLH
jgi:ribosomal protein S18 acetylase RimI-like enzyme